MFSTIFTLQLRSKQPMAHLRQKQKRLHFHSHHLTSGDRGGGGGGGTTDAFGD
jgi:hypothetical protein